jgi:hypothetical protein
MKHLRIRSGRTRTHAAATVRAREEGRRSGNQVAGAALADLRRGFARGSSWTFSTTLQWMQL